MKSLIALVALLFTLAAPAQAAFTSDRIAVTTTGNGPDVVLIHGLSSSAKVWTDTVHAVPGYRYHLVQIAGFDGHPPAGNGGEGPLLAPVAEDIARYIADETVAPALVGHSMGGTLAMMVAARHPQILSKLMVVDMLPFLGPMFGGPAATPESVAPLAAQIRDRMAASSDEERRKSMEPTIAGMIRAEARRAEAMTHAMAGDPGVGARGYHDLIVTDLRPELGAIKVPTTIFYVTPAGSPLTDEQIDGFYRLSFANAPHAVLKRVPGSAHFIMYDQPEWFAEEMKAFLAK